MVSRSHLGPKLALAVTGWIGVAAAAPAAADPGDISAFSQQVYEDWLKHSPMLATQLGVDGRNDAWDDISPAGQAAQARDLRAQLARLRSTFDAAKLGPRARLQYRVLEQEFELRLERYRWRNNFYPLNQIVGLHVEVPNILSQQKITDVADAQAYIRRLETVDKLFDGLIQDLDQRAAQGLYMPKSLYPRLIRQVEGILKGAPFDDGPDNPLFADFKRKLTALKLAPAENKALMDRARAALVGDFREAYTALLSRLQQDARLTRFDGGAWQLPHGDAFYAFAVRLFTTTDLTPDDVHKIGLAEVKRIHGEMRAIMKNVGFAGSLQDFFKFVKSDRRFFFPNTEAGRAAYLARAKEVVSTISARVPDFFWALPTIPLEVRRFEAYREASAPAGYYEPGTADGRRPGTIYLNLSNMATQARYDMEPLLYHEGLPGHHMQISTILIDPTIPELRKISIWWLNSAFVEGWALYAEYLAKEMGGYGDPYSDFGRLAGELWRACRLVVDTGLHAKRWSRKTAIDYLDRNTPSTHEANVRAVDRYIAVPGQATSFKIGMTKILELRKRARAALGADFDIRAFHSVLLENGFIPLWAMEADVDRWIAATRTAAGHK